MTQEQQQAVENAAKEMYSKILYNSSIGLYDAVYNGMEVIIDNPHDFGLVTKPTENGVYIVNNGEFVNIKSLEKPEYEEFLELMHKLRIAYSIIKIKNS